MKTPVSKVTLKQHFTYHWWMYVLVLALGILGVSLLYTVTAYRVPNNRKIKVIVYGLTDADKLDGYMESVHAKELPDMERIDHECIVPDAENGLATLATRMFAREGDIYILPSDIFAGYAEEGVLEPLENDAELKAIMGENSDLTRGWRTLISADEQHLYGIPLGQLAGISSYAWADNGFLCVASSGTNMDNAQKFFRIFCRDMLSLNDSTSWKETASPQLETP